MLQAIKMEERVETKGTANNSEQVRRSWSCYGCRANDWFLVWNWSHFSYQDGGQSGLLC